MPRSRSVRGRGWLFLGAILTVPGVACTPAQAGSKMVQSQSASLAKAAARETTSSGDRVRLIPPIEGSEVATLGIESDGTRRLVSYGLRLLVRPDRSVEAANQFFPLARNIQAMELPPRLGGGFIFWILISGRTAVWSSSSWTAPLQPFAELDFEVERLIAGFDRIHVQARRTGEWAALDASTGKGLDRGSLPPSPSYGAMAFVDEWFGAVELPVRGTMVSFDAGGRWHGLGLSALALGLNDNELVVVTPNGRRALGPDGLLRSLESDQRASQEPRRVIPDGPLGEMPLRTAVLRGFAKQPGTVVVAAQGTLAEVRLSDGRVLGLREKAFPPSSVCKAIRLGPGHGFVCGDPQGKTRVLGFVDDFALTPVEEFDTPRLVRESGNGALVISGGCGPASAHAAERAYCIRTPQGERWELNARNSNGAERVVALRDGRAALISPPRPGFPGSLVIANVDGESDSKAIVSAGRAGTAESLLTKGSWLDGFVQSADGGLRGWVTGRGLFAGVRIGLDGRTRLGPAKRSIERALVSLEHALIVPSAGMAEQTTDGGFTWSDVELPVEIETDISKATRAGAGLEQGCSTLGCAFLGWLRIGWNGGAGSRPLAVATRPSATVIPSPGGGRWRLACFPTGEVSPRPARLPTPRPATESQKGENQSLWLPLVELAPPALAPGALGFETGNEGQLRAYAWAPRGSEFGRLGKFQVAIIDRFRVHGGVWTSRTTGSPWDDWVQVAEVFGYEGSTPSVWNLTLDSSGRAGVLAITARGSTDLFAIEEGRPPQLLVNASRQGIGAVTSAVRIASTYYVSAYEEGRTFRVFALEGGKARLVGQYPDAALGRTINPLLVRGTRGDALGIWGRGPGWYLFPIDTRNGAIDSPIEITARQLSSAPPPCSPDEEGYLLEGPLGIDPYVEFTHSEGLAARAFEGRFVASTARICVSELAGRAEGAIEPTPASKRPSARLPLLSLPLVLTDRSSGGRRWAFRCSREWS